MLPRHRQATPRSPSGTSAARIVRTKFQETVANALVAFRRSGPTEKDSISPIRPCSPNMPSPRSRTAVSWAAHERQRRFSAITASESRASSWNASTDTTLPTNAWAGGACSREDRTPGPDEMAAQPHRLQRLAGLAQTPRPRVAEFLANGETHARRQPQKFKVSDGRISQVRKELAANWRAFCRRRPRPCRCPTRRSSLCCSLAARRSRSNRP